MKTFLMIAALGLSFQSYAQEGSSSHEPVDSDTSIAGAAEAGHKIIKPENIRWQKAPNMVLPGAQIAVLAGDPSTKKPFVLRLRFPANYRVAPHSHPDDETVTVISGNLLWGSGEKFNERRLMALPSGTFVELKKGETHFVVTREETIVQIQGMGPFDIKYVNPDDDPRRNDSSN